MKSRPNGGGGACRLELAGRATDRWALGAASAAGRPGAGSNSGAVNLGTERMSEALGETTRNQRRRRARRQAGRLDQPPRWEHCPAPGAGSSRPAAGPAVQAAVRGVCVHPRAVYARARVHSLVQPSLGIREGLLQGPRRHRNRGGLSRLQPVWHLHTACVGGQATAASAHTPHTTHSHGFGSCSAHGESKFHFLKTSGIFFHEYYRSAVHNMKPTDREGHLSTPACVHLCACTCVCMHPCACLWVCVHV